MHDCKHAECTLLSLEPGGSRSIIIVELDLEIRTYSMLLRTNFLNNKCVWTL